MPVARALTPRVETSPAPEAVRPPSARPRPAPDGAALDAPRDDALGATLARSVELRTAPPAAAALQRMYFPDEDEEPEGSLLGGIWDWIASYLWRPKPPPPTDEPEEVYYDALEGPDTTDDDYEELPAVNVPGEQQVVVVRTSGGAAPMSDLLAVARAIVIRQDFEVNRRLLDALHRRSAFQHAHVYSPDVELAVDSALEAVRRREAAEREARALERAAIEQRKALERAELERLAALEREVLRVLAACQRIHEELRLRFKATMSTTSMRELASALLGFVVDENLGGELTRLASSIGTGLSRLTFKQFKVGDGVALKIVEAPSLLVALTLLDEAVAGRLDAQELAQRPHAHKPTKHELETRARFEKRAAAAKLSILDDDDVIPEASEDTPTPTIVVPLYVPRIFDAGWVEADMQTWVDNQVPKRYIEHKNIKDCVAHVKAHTPTTGGGTWKKHAGKTVFHISHGKKDSGDGCTLFFTKTGDTVQIVGIGQHTTGVASYVLDWKVPDFQGNVNDYTLTL